MKRAVRDQILEILSSVGEGIVYIKKAPPEEACTVLNDCCGAATMIGDALSGFLEGERHSFYAKKLAGLLERLEALNVVCASGPPAGSDITAACSVVDSLKKTLKKEPVVREVVFFPYKASMWDSLESIWRAADADPGCEACVVPIPYHDRNQDGSLGKLHFERPLFPEDVPTVHYEDYDLAGRMPDTAYIHNPYDEHNHVTSVAPRYYAAELKKHVKTLVYVPYYVAGGIGTQVIADVAVAQKTDYIIAESDEAKAQFEARGAARGRVLALGSPKVDRVLQMEKDRPPMPAEWREKLEGKKVLLLNTSLMGMLGANEKYLEKIRYLLGCVQGREDIALLWRPHPLSGATLASMRPALLNAYLKLVADFKTGGFGVFDESPDVERAIALSDAYVGEASSSLVFMYGLTGKPGYHFNFNVENDRCTEQELAEWLHTPRTLAPTRTGNRLLAPAAEYNRLLTVNPDTGESEPVASFPGYPAWQPLLFGQGIAVGDLVLFPPWRAGAFALYNTQSGAFEQVPVPNAALPGTRWNTALFCDGHLYGDSVFFAPVLARALVEYNTKTGKWTCHTRWREPLAAFAADDNQPFFQSSCLVGARLYLPFSQGNLVLEFSLETKASKIHTVGNPGNSYHGIAFDGTAFWLTQARESLANFAPERVGTDAEGIVRWDPKSGETTEYTDFPAGFSNCRNNRSNFAWICAQNGFVWAFPQFGSMVVRIAPETGVLEEVPVPAAALSARSALYYGFGFTYAVPLDGDTLLAQSRYDHSLLKLNTRTGEAAHIPTALGIETRQMKETFFPPAHFEQPLFPNYMMEEPAFPFDSFVRDLLAGVLPAVREETARFYAELVANGDGRCGQAVHERMKKIPL